MEISDAAWNRTLRDGAETLGVALTRTMQDQLTRHATELLRWNRKTNLTSITEPREFAVKHILDSFAPVPLIPAGAPLLDIGSGGGFPGLVLKIVRPDLPITLVDAVRKKTSFLSHAIRTLGLKEITARHTRVETLAPDPLYHQSFQIIVCRALCTLGDFVAMALPLLAPEGTLIALKGKAEETASEFAEISPESRAEPVSGMDIPNLVATTTSYRLPYLDLERTLVSLRRNVA